MKAIDQLIEKYKGLSQNETHFLETVEDLEALKAQLSTNVITDNSKVNENLLEENRQLKEHLHNKQQLKK